jgi:hypothetical protein
MNKISITKVPYRLLTVDTGDVLGTGRNENKSIDFIIFNLDGFTFLSSSALTSYSILMNST